VSESEIQQLIQIAGPEVQSILMRNNSGAMKDSTGRVVRYGLGNVSKKQNDTFKSSDLIGLTCVTVVPAMIGRTIAVFSAIEVKEEGWKFSNTPREIAQKNFIEFVRLKGGIAGFASSVDQFKAIKADYIDYITI
jgi:hypothetical protein